MPVHLGTKASIAISQPQESWRVGKKIYDLQSQNTEYVALYRASLLLLLSTRDYMIYE